MELERDKKWVESRMKLVWVDRNVVDIKKSLLAMQNFRINLSFETRLCRGDRGRLSYGVDCQKAYNSINIWKILFLYCRLLMYY